MPQDEIVATIRSRWDLAEVPSRGAAPAQRWRYADGRLRPRGGMGPEDIARWTAAIDREGHG